MSRERLALGVLLAALATASLLFWWLAATPTEELRAAAPVATHPDTAPRDSGPQLVAPASAPSPSPPETTPPERTRVAVDPAVPPEASATTATLTGRCVAATGAPLADCELSLTGVLPQGLTAKSAADGSFAVAFTPVRRCEVRVVARHRAHLDASHLWPEVLPGARLELGNLTLRPGCVVSGTVLDVAGQPVAELALRALPSGTDWTTDPRQAVAATDGEGGFVLDAALAPGRWVLRADPRQFLAPAVFTVGAASTQCLYLQLAPQREPRYIVGWVVDAKDHPVAGVGVRVIEPAGVQSTRSRPDGLFHLLGWDGDADATVVLTPGDGGAPDAPTRIAWGTNDAKLVWQRGTTLRVRLRGGGPEQWAKCKVGAAAVGMTEAVNPRHWPPAPQRDTSVPVDAQGVAVLASLPAGHYVVGAFGAPSCTAIPVQVDVGGQREREVEVLLVANVERTLELRYADGRPATRDTSGARVAWSHPAASLAARTHMSGSGPGLRAQYQSVDAQGRVRISGLAGQTGTLEVRGRHGVLFSRADVVLDACPEPWIEVLPPSATLELVFTEVPEASRRQARLGLVRPDGTPWSAADVGMPVVKRAPDQPQPSGTLRLPDVPPGDWRIVLRRGWRTDVVAEVAGLAAGETRRVELRLARFADIGVTGTLRWNGRPYVGGVRLLDVDQVAESGRRGWPIVIPSPEGRLDGLAPPGRYRAAITHPLTMHMLLIGEPIELREGAPAQFDLHLRSRAVAARVSRSGRPWRGAVLRVELVPGHRLDFAATDELGCAEAAMPIGTHPCGLVTDTGVESLGALQVFPGDGSLLWLVDRP